MISKINPFAICAICLLAASNLIAANQQFHRLNQEFVQQSSQISHQNSPGHYEFEVAPDMKPPSVRKPPYLHSSQLCPGSVDQFMSFSPKNTLCGDLNEGKVPVNPLGQNIGDQAYPFELIKNKTLQFLARALPVLKLEAETIPKVARFVPHNELLNPTHQNSALRFEQMQHLNQRLGELDGNVLADYPQPAFLKRRKKRSSRQEPHEDAAGVATIAELMPNASLVVSSAHSSGGRISNGRLRDSSELAVITKNGFKPFSMNSNNNNNNYQSSVGVKSAANSTSAQSKPSNSASQYWAPTIQLTGGSLWVNGGSDSANKSQKSLMQSTGRSKLATNNGEQVSWTNNNTNIAANSSSPIESNENHANQQLDSRQVAAHSSASVKSVGQGRSSGDLSAPTSSPVSASATANSGGSQQVSAHQSKQETSGKSRLTCAESNSGFTSAICQAASALIEGDRPPAWLQLVKTLSNAYSTSSDSFNSPMSGSSSPIWTLLSGLMQDTQTIAKSGGNNPSKPNLINVLTSFLTGASNRRESSSPASASSDSSQSKEHQAHGLSLANIGSSTLARLALAGWASNAITGLVEYFAPSVFQTNSRGFAKRKKTFDPQESFVDTPASVAAALSASQLKPQLGKQPPTPCPSVEEYISPTFARNYQGAWKYVVQIPHEGYFTQTIQRTSCLRQKCEFTEGVCHESPRWVSLLVAEIYYPDAVFSQQQSNPVPSSTNPQMLATAASNNNIQQVAMVQQQQMPKQNLDPLQMTDSLNTYNHNLNSAFINAANQLGWDPNNVANMQQLANAYNYQLMQRNGLLGSQIQPAAESRSSNVVYSASQQSPAYQYSPSQYSPIKDDQAYNADYIAALATATLQQNPNMSIQDLINSLQMQQSRRKKRDVAQDRNQQLNIHQNVYQQRSSSAESPNSINDINSQPAKSNSMNQFNKQPNLDQQVSALSGQSQSHPAPNQAEPTQAGAESGNSQVDCDGRDKIGCYVVRVYYDWFLVNGSCKCWKTSTGNSQTSSSSGGNSFLRRIFTG